MKKALITGVTGQDGSYLAEFLLENGRRYRRLEAEYSRLVTEASLDALKKTAEDS